jgi:hypothetical protein
MSRLIATLNLYQEADGTFEVTVSGSFERAQNTTPGDVDMKPIDHIENRILAAADRMHQRKRRDGTFRAV